MRAFVKIYRRKNKAKNRLISALLALAVLFSSAAAGTLADTATADIIIAKTAIILISFFVDFIKTNLLFYVFTTHNYTFS